MTKIGAGKYNFTRDQLIHATKTGQYVFTEPQENVSIEEGTEIGNALIEFLETDKSGIGVSACQFGLNKRVCAIYVKDPIILINPRIEFPSEDCNLEFVFAEGCLSLPNAIAKTKRKSIIRVHADNLGDSSLYADVTEHVKSNRFRSSELIEAVAVQHEIDHTNNILMTDDIRKWIHKQIRNPLKNVGRNSIVAARNISTNEIIQCKFKKIQGNSNWVITAFS